MELLNLKTRKEEHIILEAICTYGIAVIYELINIYCNRMLLLKVN